MGICVQRGLGQTVRLRSPTIVFEKLNLKIFYNIKLSHFFCKVNLKTKRLWKQILKKAKIEHNVSIIMFYIEMQEIVDEVNAVRKERYEKQNRI